MTEDKRKTKKYFILSVLILVFGGLGYLVTSFALTIKPPVGNPTLKISNTNSGVTLNQSTQDHSTHPKLETQDEVYHFLVAGLDAVSDNTDTIMVVTFNVTQKKVNVLSIPRDTMVDVDRKVKKINAAYELGGIEQFEEEVASVTGFYVNRYVLIDLEGVEKIIDEIGGIDFNVPRNMHYDDPTQNLHIHFKKGFQHLNGEQTVKIARYRSGYTNGDIDRISLQQELLKVLAEQAFQAKNIAKLPALVDLTMEYVKTDMTAGQMLWLANQAKDIPLHEIKTSVVPGKAEMVDGLSYWVPDKEELLTIINDSINPAGSPAKEVNSSPLPYNGG